MSRGCIKTGWSRKVNLGPAVHGRCHDNLRCETLAAGAALPLLEEGEECEGEPVRADSVGGQSLVKVLFGDRIEVRFHERLCLCLSRRLEGAGGDTREAKSVKF